MPCGHKTNFGLVQNVNVNLECIFTKYLIRLSIIFLKGTSLMLPSHELKHSPRILFVYLCYYPSKNLSNEDIGTYGVQLQVE